VCIFLSDYTHPGQPAATGWNSTTLQIQRPAWGLVIEC
jgi:hypothetical protein